MNANSEQFIEQYFKGSKFLVRGKKYHSPLPPELAPYYCYITDGGHSILVLIEGFFDENSSNPFDDLCPAPVKSVLRKYRIHGSGFPVAPLQYNDTLGLITDPADDEF